MPPPPPTPDDLVLRGTVESIVPADLGPAGRFRVRLAVQAVEQGSFEGKHFDFAVHSPVKSGLEQGGSYTVRAVGVPGGWQVDPLQWLR